MQLYISKLQAPRNVQSSLCYYLNLVFKRSDPKNYNYWVNP